MKHTPGPWKAVWNGYYYDIAVPTSEPVKANIASVHENEFYPETEGKAEANARLIAAAPDMKNVLMKWRAWEAKLVMTKSVWETENGLPQFTQELYDEYMELQGQREAAIAKAKGENR